jgi:hypothetical protein
VSGVKEKGTFLLAFKKACEVLQLLIELIKLVRKLNEVFAYTLHLNFL